MGGEQYIHLGRKTAVVCFLLGTVIFGLYFLSSAFELLIVGYLYMGLAAMVNVGILIAMLFKAYRDRINRKRLMATAGLMLLNIPVAISYCWVAIILVDTLRITFTNATPAKITEIHITGCSKAHIKELDAGESETV